MDQGSKLKNTAGAAPVSPQPGAPDTAKEPEQHWAIKIIMGLLGAAVVIGLLTPGAAWVGWPIFAIGAITSISFVIKAFKQAAHSRPLVKLFLIVGGLGVGLVIFLIGVIAAFIAVASKDPNFFSFG